MRKKLVSFIGLTFTFGVAVSVQPLLANHQASLPPLTPNSINLSESAQTPQRDRVTPASASDDLPQTQSSIANPNSSVAVEPQQAASNPRPSTVRLEVSLSRRQVTVYNGTAPVKTYPVAIGRPGHDTPTGRFEVRQMRRNPTWINPATGQKFKAGTPGHQIGTRWIGFWTDGLNWIGFHGTPYPSSIGQAASEGCLRMHQNDLEELFEQVRLGTLVTVVD
ncbi:MAG: L,D-transpeptidase family protein [Desertifilum sp. SIO1I2]|nr:L,D-transpeptidase family protein [Desertifilum sp. SIO1I2]